MNKYEVSFFVYVGYLIGVRGQDIPLLPILVELAGILSTVIVVVGFLSRKFKKQE